MSGNPVDWCRLLDVEFANQDERSLKKAYARKIKTIDAVTEQREFQDVRAAFEGLRAVVKRQSLSKSKPAPLPSFTPMEPRDEAGSEAGRNRLGKEPRNSPTPPRPPDPIRPRPEPGPPRLHERPFQEPTRVKPSDNETAVSELIERIRQCLKAPWASNAFPDALSDPLLDQMAVANRIELVIGTEIIAFARQPEKDHELPPSLDRSALKALEERFSWYSDVPRLRKTFGFASQHLLNALMLAPDRPTGDLGTAGIERSLTPRPKLTLMHVIVLLLVPPWFASSLFIVVFVYGVMDHLLGYIAP